MVDWTLSQWIIIPLIVLGDLVVAVSILGLFLWPVGHYALDTLKRSKSK